MVINIQISLGCQWISKGVLIAHISVVVGMCIEKIPYNLHIIKNKINTSIINYIDTVAT